MIEKDISNNISQTQHIAQCPVDHSAFMTDERLTYHTAPNANLDAPAIEQDADGVWHIRDYFAARTLLRANTTQAGFNSELIADNPQLTNPPILFLEGKPHMEMRRQTARFFTPKSTKHYYQQMVDFAEEVVKRLRENGRYDLNELTMEMAMLVAGKVLGLPDNDIAGQSKRVSSLVEIETPQFSWRPAPLWRFLVGQAKVIQFYFKDVRPAIQARRDNPQEDVISHLLEQGYSDADVLTECLMYGAAGMVTTREFICSAFLHLMRNESLRETYLAGDEKARYSLLHELLRMEPVVSNLLRRTQEPVEITVQDETIIIPADALVNIDVYAVNADEQAVGEAPRHACPVRELAPKVQEPAMSFGDGHHRCVGAYIAIQESDIFLHRLLQVEGLKIEKEPAITRNEVIKSYELRDFYITIA